jgi:hypothetical protein
MHRKATALLSSLVLLTACEAQSSIQSRYMSQQSDCRDTAEERMGASPGTENEPVKQRNAQLVDYFSTCMIKAGWHVARPVKNPIVPTPAATASSSKGATEKATEAALPAQPVQASPAATKPATAANPQTPARPNEAVKTQSTTLQPDGSSPPLSEPVTAPAAATYQPARSYVAPANNDAAGAGRQF